VDRSSNCEIELAGEMILAPDAESRCEGVKVLEERIRHLPVGSDELWNAKAALAKGYQNLGQHRLALEAMSSLPDHPLIKAERAVSMAALGQHKAVSNLIDEMVSSAEFEALPLRDRSLVCLDIGKALHSGGSLARAFDYYGQARKGFGSIPDERDHYARATANLGFIMLKSHLLETQKQGLALIDESSDIKAEVGDLEGLGTNYSQLGLYYLRLNRFQRALVYTRQDLSIARKIGDMRGVASSLMNLAALYCVLKQLTPARKLLIEATKIGEDLTDAQLLEELSAARRHIDDAGRTAGKNGEGIGATAKCACGSGKEYQHCCGLADFEPEEMPAIELTGPGEAIGVMENVRSRGAQPIVLDYILRDVDGVRDRHAFSQIEVHDGWVSVQELPDIANVHLSSASALADEAAAEVDSIAKPTACLMLSASALEAFINQVAFWLEDISKSPDGAVLNIPTELQNDTLSFQRRTSFGEKWRIVGNALVPGMWPPPEPLWSNFQFLVNVRNEMVHFKSFQYEQIVPKPKENHPILRRLPSGIELRNIPRSWPNRLLTPSFATWCVKTAEQTIKFFKQQYQASRGTSDFASSC
jgi:tetratricopeptide (TPR) repeat protein